jgi:hypothetical protein
VIIEHKSNIRPGYSAVVDVQLKQLIALIDPKTGKTIGQHPKFIKQDQLQMQDLNYHNLFLWNYLNIFLGLVDVYYVIKVELLLLEKLLQSSNKNYSCFLYFFIVILIKLKDSQIVFLLYI